MCDLEKCCAGFEVCFCSNMDFLHNTPPPHSLSDKKIQMFNTLTKLNIIQSLSLHVFPAFYPSSLVWFVRQMEICQKMGF